MAIVTFECDVCKRTIDKVQNKKGLEVIGRCVITEGCKGKLHRIGFSADHITGQQTPSVDGLTDWSQRKVLYTHYQNTLSDSWKVKHYLNNDPNVEVFIQTSTIYPDQISEIIPESIVYDNENELTVNLASRYKGIAQCIVLSTSKSEYTAESVSSIAALQATTNSELTIATLNSDPTLEVTLTFLSPKNLAVITTKTYTFDDTPGVNSTWKSGTTSKVLINGKIYTVRSHSIDSNDLVQNGVENGTPFYVSDVNGSEPVSKESFILLTNSPYESVDINTSQIIDVSSINVSTAATAFYYNRQEFYAYENTTESIYPPIRKLNA